VDPPTIPMGSADAIGLAFLFRDCAREHLHRCGDYGVAQELMTNDG